MEIIIILIALLIVWRILISLAKSSNAYYEFVVNGIKPEIDKLIKNQPTSRKFVQILNNLQQWKKFSSENYLKKRFQEDKQLQENTKKGIPIFKENIAYYQSSYDRILGEFRLKKPMLKWYVSFQIEKDFKKIQEKFRNSSYNNMFNVEWRYTSPQGRNNYEAKSKFTLYQVSQILSQMQENNVSNSKQITKSSINDNVTITKSSFSNNNNIESIIDVTGQSTIIRSNVVLAKYIPGIPFWSHQYVYSYSELNNTSVKQKEFYRSFKYSFLNGVYYELEGNTNYAFILLFDLLNDYDNHKNISTLESQLKILGQCYYKTKRYADSFLKQKKEKDNIKNSSLNNFKSDSIIDLQNDKTQIIFKKPNLNNYISEIPEWKNQYVYSFFDINQASNEQKEFYNIFKNSFLIGKYYNLFKNTNYAFILINDFKNEYEVTKNLLKLQTQLITIGEICPDTKPYVGLILKQKEEEVNISTSNNINTYPNNNYYEDNWELGSKYKNKLKLNKAEVKLLNAIYNPSNNFFNIEYCGLEIIKLYIAVISALVNKYIEEETSIDEQFEAVSDIIARKQFRYRKGSQNYKFCIENSPNEFFSHIFKCCENEVRELYNHKRKLNTDNYCSNVEANTEFETKISSKVNDLISILISKVSKPDETTEIELYSQNTSRWKIKFEELVANYNEKPKEFVNAIIVLGKLNKKNPSVENVFFEASKFIAKYDEESSLYLYIHYLYEDLKSATFDNKQHTKTIQKSLFKTNEQLHNFEKIVSELIRDKDLEKALKQIPEIYKVKRKKIQLNRDSIKEVIEQHSETVELLNEYLKDDFEDENNSIKSQEISIDEIQIEIIQKREEVHQTAFISELTFTAIHTTTLELFAKSNFSISQDEFELFAKSKGVFKNQLIESINDTCYEFLDDVLIEEEEDYYTINTNYFQRISTK